MRSILAACLALGFAGPAAASHLRGHPEAPTVVAQGGHQGHGQHGSAPAKAADAPATAADAPATAAFKAANERMHKDMAISYSGDADIDFVRSMIPHHRGAIDMAKVALAHAKDPANRKLAEEILKAQEAEIAQMQAWLAKRGVAP